MPKKKWAERQQGDEGGGHKKPSRVWILDAGKTLRAVMVTTGLNDNRYVEILSGDLNLLVGLNLMDASGNNYDPTSTYSAFRSWLLGGTATNMANMLSVQLATMELAAFNSKVSANAKVYAPGLVTYGLTTAGGFINTPALWVGGDSGRRRSRGVLNPLVEHRVRVVEVRRHRLVLDDID